MIAQNDHCKDVIMGAITSKITSFTIVYSIVYSDADERKHQSSASLAFVRGIHWGPVNSPHKWPVTRKMFPFDDVIMFTWIWSWRNTKGPEKVLKFHTQISLWTMDKSWTLQFVPQVQTAESGPFTCHMTGVVMWPIPFWQYHKAYQWVGH